MTSRSDEYETIYIEIPVVVRLRHHPDMKGARDPGGPPLEPDEPAWTEVIDIEPESDNITWNDVLMSEVEKIYGNT